MPNRLQKDVLPQLCKLIHSRDTRDVSDGQLLEGFAVHRDPAAFAALVRRHGRTVLGVCRRVLNNPADAEDAFQATFLLLVRKARSVAKQEAVGSWLYGVAYRVALRARADARRRRHHERQAAASVPDSRKNGWVEAEVLAILDEEVNRLPEKYRRPIVLCYFEGRTYREAAHLLGWPAGTASVRLARAREMLRARLARRGMRLSATAVAAVLAEAVATAGEPHLLVGSMVALAVRFLADPGAAGISVRVVALTEGVVKAMVLRKLNLVAGIVLALGVACGGVGALCRLGEAPPAMAAVSNAPGAEAAPPPTATDDPRTEAPERAGPPVRALAPPADPARPPHTRIGLINMTRLLKASKKFQSLERDMRTRTQHLQKELEVGRLRYQQYKAEMDNPATSASHREKLARQMRQAQREMEDREASAKRTLNDERADALRIMYQEVEDAGQRLARARGLELVLFYTDAVTEADFYRPANLERKLTQPGALMPLFVAPGMDITEGLVEILNRHAAAQEGRQ